MEIYKALEILEQHNSWRRGNDDIEMYDPKLIGEAIDTIVVSFKVCLDLHTCNRVEVIDENGRSYVNWKKDNNISIHFQDNNKTVKIFIDQNKDS